MPPQDDVRTFPMTQKIQRSKTPESDCPEKTSQIRSNSSSVLSGHSHSRPCSIDRYNTPSCRHRVGLVRCQHGAVAAAPVYSHKPRGHLQDQALLRLLLFPGEQGSSCGVLEHLSDTLVRLCGALEVLLGANLLADILGLRRVSEAVGGGFG